MVKGKCLVGFEAVDLPQWADAKEAFISVFIKKIFEDSIDDYGLPESRLSGGFEQII